MVEEPGRKDADVPGVVVGVGEAQEEFLRVGGEEGDRKGVNGELNCVGGEAEGQPGKVTHRKGAVELHREYVEVSCEGGSQVSSVGNQEGNRVSHVNRGSDRKGEGTVSIPEDACSDV